MLTIIACIKYIRTELLSSSQQSKNKYVINPYDLYMLTQLMEFKKMIPCRIVSVTMGALGCMENVNKSMAFGFDEAYLICDSCFAGSDTYATSYVLSKALEHIGQADIYAFGEKAMDGETGQVPIGVASHLNMLCITGVIKFSPIEEGKIKLKRQFENQLESIETVAPCILCFRGFTTKEPQVSLLKLKQSRKYTPIVLSAETLKVDKQHCGHSGSKTRVQNIVQTIQKREVKVLEGDVSFKASMLRKIITGYGGNNS